MCGINGIVIKNNQNTIDIVKALSVMNNKIIHRGPDDFGTYHSNSKNYALGMAMRRLSIIDLNSGKQPMFSEDKKITIVFNGEIYNYKQLQKKLISSGKKLYTNSDTEVILKLYELYGVDSFKMLDGMYAFSIHDLNLEKLFIARDYFGEKPLYYTNTDKELFWASELKSITCNLKKKPEICKTAINLFFRLTYIPSPYTIYTNINKLEPNSYIDHDLVKNTLQIHEIHPKTCKKSKLSFNKAKEKVNDLVYKSVESRSISDVNLGTFLSGGVDSSIVSLCLSQIKDTKIDTFSIGFDKASFDETDKSRVVAKLINSNHNEFIIKEDDLKDDLDKILLNFDEPFADSSALPTYIVSKLTRSKVKVALTGDGGDEVFGGYNKYYIGKLNKTYKSLVPKAFHKSIHSYLNTHLKRKPDDSSFKYKLNKLLNSISYDNSFYWDIISLGYQSNQIQDIIKDEFLIDGIFDHYKSKSKISKPTSLDDFRTIDQHISLEGDMLVKVDRTSMLNSLECRAPFLNRELFEFASSLPSKYLLKNWNKKYILKEAFKTSFPDEFLEKKKQGFGVPVGDWLRSSLKAELLTYIDKDFVIRQGIFNFEYIEKIVLNHINLKEDNSFKVWTYYCFQKWYTCIYNGNA